MFIYLPRSVLSDLLAIWIALPSVGMLDSAFCSNESRVQLLSHLEASSFGNKLVIGEYCSSEAFYDWVLKRKVKLHVAELVIDDILITKVKLRHDMLGLIGKDLLKVTICNSNENAAVLDRTILDVALHCTKLRACDIYKYSDLSMTSLLARNPKLQRVVLHACMSPSSSEILHAIGMLCPQILTIDLRCSVADMSFQMFLSSIPLTLESLCLRRCNKLTWQMLLSILRQCNNLCELRTGSIFNELPNIQTICAFTGMRTFRASSSYLDQRVLTTLARLMPNLTTLLFPRHNVPSAQLLKHFVYLRQLVTIPEFEDKLSILRPTAINEIDKMPVPGSCLEELYDNLPAECLSSVTLPALRTIGCKYVAEPLPLSPQVKKVCMLREAHDMNLSAITNLSGLEELDLVFSHALCNQIIRRLAVQNPQLKVLSIQQTLPALKPIGEDGLWTFLTHCPQLHSVVYTCKRAGQNTSNTSTSSNTLLRKAIMRAFPNLQNFTCSVLVD